MQFWMGVDPGLRETAYAILLFDEGQRPKLQHLGMARTFGAARPVEAMVHELRALSAIPVNGAVVESQQHYNTAARGNARANPAELIKLATVAGAALAFTRGLDYGPPILHNPLPAEWKGQISKSAHHKRIADEMGWPISRAGECVVPEVPASFTNIKIGDWYHLFDAVGMALWGYRQGANFVKKAVVKKTMRADARAAKKAESNLPRCTGSGRVRTYNGDWEDCGRCMGRGCHD